MERVKFDIWVWDKKDKKILFLRIFGVFDINLIREVN